MAKQNFAGIVVAGGVAAVVGFTVALLVLKLLWAWTVPDLFPGAVEAGLVAKSLSWVAAMKVALWIAVLAAFFKGTAEVRVDWQRKV